MSLFRHFLDLFSVPKLHKEIERLRSEVAHEHGQLVITRSQLSDAADRYYAVSQPIDVSGMHQRIFLRLVEEFRPIVQPHLYEILLKAVKVYDGAPEARGARGLIASLHTSPDRPIYEVRINFPALNARVMIT